MGLSPTEVKLLTFISRNGNRNRKITGGSASREMGHSVSLIYKSSKKLREREMIKFENIDKKRKQFKITEKGENYMLNIYNN